MILRVYNREIRFMPRQEKRHHKKQKNCVDLLFGGLELWCLASITSVLLKAHHLI